jgi:hypothetical protein
MRAPNYAPGEGIPEGDTSHTDRPGRLLGDGPNGTAWTTRRQTCPSKTIRPLSADGSPSLPIGSLPANSGVKMHFTGITILRVQNGLIVEEKGLDDGVTILKQAGLIPGS